MTVIVSSGADHPQTSSGKVLNKNGILRRHLDRFFSSSPRERQGIDPAKEMDDKGGNVLNGIDNRNGAIRGLRDNGK